MLRNKGFRAQTPRHGLGRLWARQDGGARAQGPEGAVRAQPAAGLRGRPDAAAPPPAQARLPLPLPQALPDVVAAVEAGALDASRLITMKTLVDSGVSQKRVGDGIKLMGRGAEKLKVPLHLEVSRVSQVARAAVEDAGGSVVRVHYNQLGLRALLRPEWFVAKGRLLPRAARPPPKVMPQVDAIGRLPAPSEPLADAPRGWPRPGLDPKHYATGGRPPPPPPPPTPAHHLQQQAVCLAVHRGAKNLSNSCATVAGGVPMDFSVASFSCRRTWAELRDAQGTQGASAH
eukprot:SM000094S24693  [mRNA]  locus=s94:236541:238648:+ [translate_table: standard]